MNEKELVRHLSKLQSFSPNADWVKKNRETLLFQINNGREQAVVTLGFFHRVNLILHRLAQPTPIAALIALFFVVSSVFGFRASLDAKPGQTLYIAKTISEKVALSTTFNEKDKLELNVAFAKNRAAELAEVSKESAVQTSDARVEELSDNFKKEIDSARERLSKIDESAARQATIDAQAQSKVKLNIKAKPKKNNESDIKEPADEEESTVFSAESGKDKQGLDISLPGATQKVLDDAEELVKQKKYSEAINKLEEIKLK